jgi:hypothetical protein
MHATRQQLAVRPAVPPNIDPHDDATPAFDWRLRVADRLGSIAVILAAVASLGGLFAPELYRDSSEGIRQARATDLVTLAVAVPALAVGLWRARGGSAVGRVVAIGALGYLA